MTEEDRALIKRKEVEAILFAFAEGRGDKGFTEDEAQRVVEWAAQSLIDYQCYVGMVEGDLTVDINDDGEMVFGMTEQGQAVANKLLSRPLMMRGNDIVQ